MAYTAGSSNQVSSPLLPASCQAFKSSAVSCSMLPLCIRCLTPAPPKRGRVPAPTPPIAPLRPATLCPARPSAAAPRTVRRLLLSSPSSFAHDTPKGSLRWPCRCYKSENSGLRVGEARKKAASLLAQPLILRLLAAGRVGVACIERGRDPDSRGRRGHHGHPGLQPLQAGLRRAGGHDRRGGLEDSPQDEAGSHPPGSHAPRRVGR